MGQAAECNGEDHTSAVRQGDGHDLCAMARASAAALRPSKAGERRARDRRCLRLRLCQPERVHGDVPAAFRQAAIHILPLVTAGYFGLVKLTSMLKLN